MPVSKSADRYRGKMRLRDRRIKELTRPKTTVVAGVWPDDPVSALAEWCADTLIVPSGHPLAGQPMALPWYIRDFLRTPTPGLIRNDVGGVAEFLSADKSAGHASGFDYAIIDELGLMTERDRDLVAGMRSATSAKQGRLLAMSIRGESPMLEELIERRELPTAVVHLYAPDVPATGAVDIHDPDVWAAGNPGLAAGIKSSEYMAAEATRVTATPSDLSTFLAFDLNLPQSPSRETVCSVADLVACYVDTLPERSGPCYIRLDLGGAASLTGAFAVWPSTGRCEGWLRPTYNPCSVYEP